MIIVHHFRNDLDRDTRLSVRDPMTTESHALFMRACDKGLTREQREPLLREHSDLLTKLRVDAARALFVAGGYEKVAEVEGDDLDRALELTQNVENSWSRDEVPGLRALEPREFRTRDGRILGRKSSEPGDLLERDGEFFVLNGHSIAPVGRIAQPEVPRR